MSGSFGAGHDAAAHELEVRLRAAGCSVTRHDIVELLPARSGSVLKRAYYTQLRIAPDTWGRTLTMSEPGHLLHRAAVATLGLAATRASAAVRGADLVVGTHPFAGLVLGRARLRGLVSAPVVTYLTDASVHSMWVHQGVDLHLAIHEVAAREARHRGGRTVVVAPLTPTPRPHAAWDADPLAGVGVIGPRALVTGGSLGIGDLEQAARDIAASGVMTPVVACGQNTGLERRLARAGIPALAWRNDMPEVIGACHCVVQNAGGYTSLEALAAGTPVLTYRPIPGHGITNARSLEEAGLAPWPRTHLELRTELRHALMSGRSRLVSAAPSVVDVLTSRDWSRQQPTMTDPFDGGPASSQGSVA